LPGPRVHRRSPPRPHQPPSLDDPRLRAGTQAFTVGIGTAIFGTSDLVGDLSRVAAWVINLTVAELIIRRTIRRPARRRTPAPSTAVQSIT
jgi:hypothetical protein